METSKLRKFAQFARRSLIEQVSAKLKLVLAESSAARRESVNAVKELEDQIKHHGKGQVIEKVAYTWFNRFCALRFMDVKRYTRIGVVSPAGGQFQPQILAEAKMGHIDESMVAEKTRQQIFALLDGSAPSRDPQSEAYRLLVVAACNDHHKAMPYLFERIADYTELLMPDDLLSGNSILAYTREAMTPDVCEDVEVIGWLYQFYISEKKDDVFASLKKGKKIAPENIPAATQLFTPHWIVRYLVENSLGRLWMINRPNSRLKERMDYYIEPEQAEAGFLKISSPEEIKICDPACGSGHMLTYAFDLLYAIYEEEGYDPPDIPGLILEKNLYGIEIDERAGALAAFALVMKAREKYKRLFAKPVQPLICVLENIVFEDNELKPYMDEIGRDLFTINLKDTLHQFREADNFGSLIRPALTDVAHIRRVLREKDAGGNIFLYKTHEKVLKTLKQTDFLCPKYHVVVANPPYMGAKSMSARLKAWAKNNYSTSKYDLFSMFIERSMQLVAKNGFVSMITMQSWMFLSTYEKLRKIILNNGSIVAMAHLGARAFDSIGGEVVSTTAFIIQDGASIDSEGVFIDLRTGRNENEKSQLLVKNVNQAIHRVTSLDFQKIPCWPIAYWVKQNVLEAFSINKNISDVALPKQGLSTCNNDLFLRQWYEVSINKIGFGYQNRNAALLSKFKWFPYNKGGSYRKWYGNNEHIVNWENDGKDIHEYNNLPLNYNGAPVRGKNYYFKKGMTWSSLAGVFSGRLSPYGFAFDAKGPVLFSTNSDAPTNFLMGCLNSKAVFVFLQILAPTLDFNQGPIGRVPFPERYPALKGRIKKLIDYEKTDWDSYETSWDFASLPLLHLDHRQLSIATTYTHLRLHWKKETLEVQRIEEENNRTFIEAYGLQDDLTSEVPLHEITLTCNQHYRYGGNKNEEELEALLLADTMREFISYAVGCMFGRYALDKPGLILANQGETIEDYLQQIPEPTFPADDDNVIPVLDGDWFTDDITEKFRKFLRVTFGEEHYEENLAFIEKTIGKDIRKFFLKDFYGDHVKRYKKRPIYWMYSSPKGSFNVLIYMHRYRTDTVSVILNDYLREFKIKLTARKDHLEQIGISASAKQSDKTSALKEIENLRKILDELENWERDVLYPLATRRIEIDLDDGVKINYNKFGTALKKVPGLSVK